jgi:hypothetical protein
MMTMTTRKWWNWRLHKDGDMVLMFSRTDKNHKNLRATNPLPGISTMLKYSVVFYHPHCTVR